MDLYATRSPAQHKILFKSLYSQNCVFVSGYLLSLDQERCAEEWANETHPNFFLGIMKFKLREDDVFPEHLFGDNMKSISPEKWWRIMQQKERKKMNLPEGFCEFMVNLHSCPASSGSIERIFSTFGLVWNNVRNRLGVEKAKKLVKVYRHLRKSDSA